MELSRIQAVLGTLVMAVRMRMVVVVVVVCAALTGRPGLHSTAGLAEIATAILPVPHLDPVIGNEHPEFGAKGCLVRRPVGEHCSQAGA
jgi:hypothetical protein